MSLRSVLKGQTAIIVDKNVERELGLSYLLAYIQHTYSTKQIWGTQTLLYSQVLKHNNR